MSAFARHAERRARHDASNARGKANPHLCAAPLPLTLLSGGLMGAHPRRQCGENWSCVPVYHLAPI